MSEAPLQTLPHNPRLDGVRGVAIALVLVGHAGILPWSGAPAEGVGLFFVLSGFLITTLLLTEWERTGAIGLGAFYLRRALRLLPALFALLCVYGGCAVIWSHGQARQLRLRGVWTGAAYVTNWAFALGHAGSEELGHLWSLATEEQFYLLWPCFLVLLLAFRRRRLVLGAIGGGILVFAVLRAVLYRVPSPIHDHLYFSPFTWADSLLVGCLIGGLYTWRRLPERPVPVLLLAAAALYATLVVATNAATPLYNGGLTVLALANGVFVVAAIDPSTVVAPLLALRPLRWLGRVSYAIYLWHIPLIALLRAALPAHPTLAATTAMALSLLVGAVSFNVVERPFLRLKARRATPAGSPDPPIVTTPPRVEPVPA